MSNMQECPYEVLGVPKTATIEQIKKAYWKLSKSNHPDRTGSESNQTRINIAWSILSDPERKKRYDETGRTDMSEFMSRVMSLLNQVMSSIIDDAKDITKVNIIESCKSYLNQTIDRQERTSRNISKSMDRTVEAIDRLTTVGDTTLMVFLEARRDALRADIVRLKDDIDFIKKALKLLEDYSYRVDEDSVGKGDYVDGATFRFDLSGFGNSM